MKKTLIIINLFFLVILAGCQVKKTDLCPIVEGKYSCSSGIVKISLNDIENQVLKILKEKDIEKLTELVGEKGIRFSPYSNVNIGMDAIILKNKLIGMRSENDKKEWGNYDGSGKPILLTMPEYRDKFVYDKDFSKAPERLVNKEIQRGNSISNARAIYSGATLIEYYFSGFETKYEGMDWESLTLIFDKENGEWKLLGIIHGQRTI